MKAIVSVINDLSTDQRVDKVCGSLHEIGYEVVLVGRRRRSSIRLDARSYATVRMFLLFERGPLFYLFFQLRLFLYLLFHRADVLVSNDLDTLLPNFLASRLKGCPLVYDTHELFCEVPELQTSPLKRSIWKSIERFIFPKLKYVFTVNDSIAKIYSEEYRVPVHVLRNVPRKKNVSDTGGYKTAAELGLPSTKKIILLQGAGINIQRGAEEALEAMQYLDQAVLLIIGSGDVIPRLKQMSRELRLEGKVLFIGRLPFQELRLYTHLADLGLSLDKDSNLNYRYSLPNKIFDYIQAGVPVFVSNLPEIRKIVEQYGVGVISPDHNPRNMATLMAEKLSDEALMKVWKENTKLAAEKLCWEEEEKVLEEVYRNILEK
ncbi:MAG TPA: glycosyltransferase [Bacteroidia bacterium]|jgi:glycosyltransferase involved in cell wall biosynthesis|nr:glycosyltransferase [Bacteroidia bacterium]